MENNPLIIPSGALMHVDAGVTTAALPELS